MVADVAENSGDRPQPEALLNAAQREGRGRLKVFLGAAPGVGKTYAMLQAAQARRSEGIDVVVGLVETHGRPDTQALLAGLVVIPRQSIDYRGKRLEEMDLDAILHRRPRLVLVDELAHTNVPGSRHPKRHLDVEELIAAGIDVYTTLNIQHLESLNDAVAQVTGIQVRETVPDRVLDAADDVQLIDLPPEELIQRLHEGKVYLPEQAERAVRSYFRTGNLNALRELALRRTADRVDDQMQDYMRARAIPGPWPTTDRIMVCVSPSPTSIRLVRAAKRRADRRSAEWLAVYVETPTDERLSEPERNRVDRTLQLAERLGGEAVTVPGRKPAEDLIRYARQRNVTEILIGKPLRSWWQRLRAGSLVDDLIRLSGSIDVNVISGEEERDDRPAAAPPSVRSEFRWRDYFQAAAVVLLSAAIAKGLHHFLALPNISILFLLGTLFVAVRMGLWPAMFACLLSALIYNFFFIFPLYTFTIASPQELLAFLAYFVVAVIASQLAARVREQAEAARRREDRTHALFSLSRAIAASSGLQGVAAVISHQVGEMLGARTAVLVAGPGGLSTTSTFPADTRLAAGDHAAAVWAWEHRQLTGAGTDTLPGVPWMFIPLRTAQTTVGVLGVRFTAAPSMLSQRRQRLIEGLADQAAISIERARLQEEMEQSRVLTATEKLRAALLSSVSHDLRTPLASIIGSASSLLAYGQAYDRSTQTELLNTIQEEAERLNRFVGNLLDVTRIESGRIELNRDWTELGDLIGSALARVRALIGEHQVNVSVAEQLPLVRVDFVLMEQVLVNLLDNAAKFSPSGSQVVVTARRTGHELCIEVTDQGVGVPADDLERIFDKFFRVRGGDHRVAGTGLGLFICRGIVEAHGGRIQAEVPAGGRGLTVSVRLPVEAQPPTRKEPSAGG